MRFTKWVSAALLALFILLICLFGFPAFAQVTKAAPNLIYSPYVYYGDFNDSTYQFNTSLTTYPKTQTVLSAIPSNLTTLTLAFATGECGSETWSGATGEQVASANVAAFVAAGKKYIISTGGGGHTFTCADPANFVKFVQTYYSANMIGVDFDIESGQTQNDVDNLVAGCIAAQAIYPGLRFSFTMASNGGNVLSVSTYATYVRNAVTKYGLKNYTYNLMAFDFVGPGQENASVCVMTGSACQMGLSAISAAINLHNAWGVPYTQIEITTMIGGQDTDETFYPTDIPVIATFAKQHQLAGLHFWALSRDRNCPPNKNFTSNDSCNNYGNARTLEYTNGFLTDLGE
jgi:hypothetical protein